MPRTIRVCSRCLAIVVDEVPPVLRCVTAEGEVPAHRLERVGPPTELEALAVLESFVAAARDWAEQRDAWKLVANRERAARDRAALLEHAPRETALLFLYEPGSKRYRREWAGETAGDDTENVVARREVISRYVPR